MEKIEKRRIRAKEDDKVAEGTASTPTASDGMSPLWRETMGPFFDALGISLKEGTERILAGHNGKKLIRAANDRAAQQMRNPRYVSPESLRAVFGPDEVPEADFHEAMDKLQGAPTARPNERTAPSDSSTLPNLVGRGLARRDITLPEPMEETGFLSALTRTSKLDPKSAEGIQAAVEAFFCFGLGADDIIERLYDLMLKDCKRRRVPVSAEVDEFSKTVLARRLADYGVTSDAATSASRKELFTALQGLPSALATFHCALSNWYDELHRDNGMERVMDLLRGQETEYPGFKDVVDASDPVVELFVTAFSVHGEQTTRLLAHEAAKIRRTLERDDLPKLIGVRDVQEMQDALEYRINRQDLQVQRAVVRYTLAVAKTVPNLPVGEEGATLEKIYRLGKPLKGWMETGRIGGATSNFPKPVGRNQAPTPLLGNGARQR